METRASRSCKTVFAHGKNGDGYDYGNKNIYRSKDWLIWEYRKAVLLVLFGDIAWILWPVLATVIYGPKAFFAIIAFSPLVVRIFILIYCFVTENFPFRIAGTVLSKPSEKERNEQWLRWVGALGRGHGHGIYSFFSKFVHSLIVLVAIIVQFSVRHRFAEDSFWIINCLAMLLFIIYTYNVNWLFIIYGCVIPRECAYKEGEFIP